MGHWVEVAVVREIRRNPRQETGRLEREVVVRVFQGHRPVRVVGVRRLESLLVRGDSEVGVGLGGRFSENWEG